MDQNSAQRQIEIIRTLKQNTINAIKQMEEAIAHYQNEINEKILPGFVTETDFYIEKIHYPNQLLKEEE